MPEANAPRAPGTPLAALPNLETARRSWLWRWWPLGLIMLAVLPALLISLGQRDVARVMENVSIGSSQATWHAVAGDEAQAGDARRWIVPLWAGEDRLVKPPMLVWLNIAAAELSGHDPETTPASRFITIARTVGVLLGLLAVASTYWCGLTLGDRRLAILAGAMMATAWCVIRAARTASYDGHLLGWTALSIAAALWATRPAVAEAPPRGRVILGWAVAALAATAALPTKGPLGLIVIALPVAAMGLADRSARSRWISLVLGLGAVAALPAAAFGAWYLAARQGVPELAGTLMEEYQAQRATYQPPWYYLFVVVMLAPWSGWLVAGLVHPFMRADGVQRRVRLMPWVWFVVIFVLFSIPGAKQQRYILPLMPAACLLAAMVVRDHAHLARLGRPDPGAWLLQRPVGAAIVLGSALPLLLALGDQSAKGLNLAPLSWPVAIGLTVLMLALALPAEHLLRHHRLMPGVLLTAAWMVVAVAVANRAYAIRSARLDPAPAAAVRLLETAASRPLVYYRPAKQTQPSIDDEEPLLVYLRQAIPEWDARRLAAQRAGAVVSEPTVAAAAALSELGYAPLYEFPGDKGVIRRVYVPRGEVHQ